MSNLDAIILGIIQGLTEFLPVSSSGHLVFFQKMMGYSEPLIAFDVVVHLGTLIAVLAYFFKDILGMARDGFGFIADRPKFSNWDRYFKDHVYALTLGYVLLSTLVTVALALIFKDAIEAMFSSIRVVGVAWIVMGILLFLSSQFQAGKRGLYDMAHFDAFVLGMVQGFAMVPGISRSGMTIIVGMYLGLEKKTAAKYSFLMGLFAIAGAGVLKAKEGLAFFQEAPMALIYGFLASGMVGYLAIFLLMRLVEKGKFFIFGFYCLLMSVTALFISFS